MRTALLFGILFGIWVQNFFIIYHLGAIVRALKAGTIG